MHSGKAGRNGRQTPLGAGAGAGEAAGVIRPEMRPAGVVFRPVCRDFPFVAARSDRFLRQNRYANKVSIHESKRNLT